MSVLETKKGGGRRHGNEPVSRLEPGAPPPPISRRTVLAALAVLAWDGRAVAQTPPGGASPTVPAPTGAVASAPDWPKVVKTGETTIHFYLPQLDSWDGRRLDAHAAVSIQPSAKAQPLFGVAVGRCGHAGGQGRAPGDAREPPHREGPVPVRREPGSGLPEAPPAAHPPQDPHDRAGPSRDGAGDAGGAGQGRVEAAQERSAADRVLDDPGHPHPHRWRAPLPAGRGNLLRAGRQHAAAHPEGCLRHPLPAALRRLDGGGGRDRAVERRAHRATRTSRRS